VEEQHHERRTFPKGPDGLCRDCVHRRAYLALGNVLRAGEILLVAGLPIVWTLLETRGLFRLDSAWVTLYIAGVLALTAVSFGWQFRERSRPQGQDPGT
jgi:hypothetical protein